MCLSLAVISVSISCWLRSPRQVTKAAQVPRDQTAFYSCSCATYLKFVKISYDRNINTAYCILYPQNSLHSKLQRVYIYDGWQQRESPYFIHDMHNSSVSVILLFQIWRQTLCKWCKRVADEMYSRILQSCANDHCVQNCSWWQNSEMSSYKCQVVRLYRILYSGRSTGRIMHSYSDE